MKLKVKWKYFYNQVCDYIREAEDILSIKQELCTIKSHDFILSAANSWINKCYSYLRGSFDVPDNVYAERFYTEKPYSYYLTGARNRVQLELKEVFQNLSAKKNNLQNSLRILSVCDAVIQPDLVDFKLRETYQTKDILELLVDKLFYLYDHCYYPIHTILRGNGIKIRDYKELPALILKYENDGYLKLISKSSICGQLTSKGKEMVEKKRRFDFFEKPGITSEEDVSDFEILNPYTVVNDLNTIRCIERKNLDKHGLAGRNLSKKQKNKLVVVNS